jgi:hypothetical protein
MKIQFDDGKEFYNRFLKELLEKNNIEWFSTYSDKKAAVVERFNRTQKEKMYRYFTAKETNKWFDILGDLVKGYNNSFHSSIGMTLLMLEKKITQKLFGTIFTGLISRKH